MKLEDQDWNELQRRERIQQLNDRDVIAFNRGDYSRGISAVTLISAGCVLGLLIMFVAQSCERQPMPHPGHAAIIGDINCSYCHGVKLNNRQRYVKYWKARHKFEQVKVASGRDEDAENERMVQLIVGGKP